MPLQMMIELKKKKSMIAVTMHGAISECWIPDHILKLSTAPLDEACRDLKLTSKTYYRTNSLIYLSFFI